LETADGRKGTGRTLPLCCRPRWASESDSAKSIYRWKLCLLTRVFPPANQTLFPSGLFFCSELAADSSVRGISRFACSQSVPELQVPIRDPQPKGIVRIHEFDEGMRRCVNHLLATGKREPQSEAASSPSLPSLLMACPYPTGKDGTKRVTMHPTRSAPTVSGNPLSQADSMVLTSSKCITTQPEIRTHEHLSRY
jgi:hypothetical protein